MDIQAQIPAALCSIHNFIRLHDTAEGPLPDANTSTKTTHHQDLDSERRAEEADSVGDGEDCDDVGGMHDDIAEQMWLDYQRVLRERLGDGLGMDSESEDDDHDDSVDGGDGLGI
jgi:hypothetical protein